MATEPSAVAPGQFPGKVREGEFDPALPRSVLLYRRGVPSRDADGVRCEGLGMVEEVCAHIKSIKLIKLPEERACEECVKLGSRWVHLRTCQTCGNTLCCDSSPNRHATKHARATEHPVIASAQPGERWMYCYPDEAYTEY